MAPRTQSKRSARARQGGTRRGARPHTRLRCSRCHRRASPSDAGPGGGWRRGRSRGPLGAARCPCARGRQAGNPAAPAAPQSRRPTVPRPPQPAPEQHARHREVGEGADPPRHQLQLGVRHGCVRAGECAGKPGSVRTAPSRPFRNTHPKAEPAPTPLLLDRPPSAARAGRGAAAPWGGRGRLRSSPAAARAPRPELGIPLGVGPAGAQRPATPGSGSAVLVRPGALLRGR